MSQAIITYPPQRKTQPLTLRAKLSRLQDEATAARSKLGDLRYQIKAIELELAATNCVVIDAH